MGVAVNNQELIVEDAANGVVSYKGQKYQVNDYGEIAEYVPMWIQNGETVTKDGVTLNVGIQVSGYSATPTIEGNPTTVNNWYVLGAENGNLLITTNQTYERIELSGIEDYLGGINKLNNVAMKYIDDNGKASTARSIKYNDLNKITGFNPTTNYEGSLKGYGNEVTYTQAANDTIYYRCSNGYQDSNTYGGSGTLTYWRGDEWVSLGLGESVTIKNTFTGYSSNDTNSTMAKEMFFNNTGHYPGDEGSYWVATDFVECWANRVSYGIYEISCGYLSHDGTLCSAGNNQTATRGVRPVVILKPETQVLSDGSIL